ncbi:MAG: Fe-S cluster assembly protein SufD [Gemmatimonadaceae bacterium]|nr:Fe-S cluster assembly protein SufD [Gemmatimonadaceae bacterium]
MTTAVQDRRATPPTSGRAPEAYVRDFDATLAATAHQPAWVTALRRAGHASLVKHGFPTTKNEDWHFTSVAAIAESDFLAMTAPGGDVTAADVARFGFGQSEWHTMVFVNGHFDGSLSSLDRLPAGIRVLPLAQAIAEIPDLVERHLGRVTAMDGQAEAFTALNAMYMTDGAVIHVAADTVVREPVHLLFLTDAMAARGIIHPRNLVVCDRHAKATVIESYAATGDAHYFTNAVTEAVVADGATLTHLKLQRESSRAFHVSTTDAAQGRDSHFVSFSFGVGADLSRSNVFTRLAGAGCGATLNGLYLLDGAQHMDHQTNIVHVEPNCYSRELYKGILDGRSHGVFNGKVYVFPEAQKTDGKQTNNTLLLSETAHIDTKPQLEIFADDVKCTHGATIGRLDEMALFYMKSRGIGNEFARQLLTYAFAADALETIELEAVRDGLEELVLRRYTA